MQRVLWVFVAALTLAPNAFAEIFKCTAKDGLTRYQNFPCDVDSLGSPASPPPAINKAAVEPKSNPVPAAVAAPPALPGEPRVGMTADEVRTIWGEPAEVLQDEPRTGRVAIWQYPDGRIVQLNNKQRVISIQQ